MRTVAKLLFCLGVAAVLLGCSEKRTALECVRYERVKEGGNTTLRCCETRRVPLEGPLEGETDVRR